MNEFWTEQLTVDADLLMKLHTSQEQYTSTDLALAREFLAHETGGKVYVMGRPVTQGMGLAQRAGNAQAWYYPADGVLVLWECYLYEHVRKSRRAAEDAKHRRLWETFEEELIRRFRPAVVVSPAWEPVYETEDWQAFLETEGYTIEGRIAIKKLHR